MPTAKKTISNIRPELASLATPINKVKPHPRNVRQGDVGAIATSLEAHGQYRPIVVHKRTGFIIAGNHTYLAARSLEWSEIACTFVDCTEEQALRILLTDNRANDLASYDDQGLIDLLTELMNTPNQLDGTLFDPADLDDLIGLLTPPNLDDLISDLGGEHDDDDHDDFTGVIKLRVPLSLHQRWNDLWQELPGETDESKLTELLDGYESHR